MNFWSTRYLGANEHNTSNLQLSGSGKKKKKTVCVCMEEGGGLKQMGQNVNNW